MNGLEKVVAALNNNKELHLSVYTYDEKGKLLEVYTSFDPLTRLDRCMYFATECATDKRAHHIVLVAHEPNVFVPTESVKLY